MGKSFIIIDDVSKMVDSIAKQIKNLNQNLTGYQLIITKDSICLNELDKTNSNVKEYEENLKDYLETKFDAWLNDIVNKIINLSLDDEVLVIIDTFLFNKELNDDIEQIYKKEKYMSSRIYLKLLQQRKNNLKFFMYSRGDDGRNIISKALNEISQEGNDKKLSQNYYAKDMISYVSSYDMKQMDLNCNYLDKPLNIPNSFKKIIEQM